MLRVIRWCCLCLFVLSQNEAVVLEAAVAPSQNLHVVVPLIVAIKNGLDKVRLAVGDVEKETIIFQNSLNLS